MTNPMTCATVFSLNGMDLLRSAANTAETPEDFFVQVEEIMSDSVNLISYEPPIALPRPLINGEKDDYRNAAAIYEAVGPIDRANASDPRLWAYLALNTCKDFMSKRWPLKDDKWKNRLRDRWLMPETPTRSNLTRHGIARLWWLAELTYDGNLEHKLSGRQHDQYAYTKWIFENQDRIVAITERAFGSNDAVRWALMDSMVDDDRSDKGRAIKTATKSLRLELSFRNFNVLGDEINGVMDSLCRPEATDADND